MIRAAAVACFLASLAWTIYYQARIVPILDTLITDGQKRFTTSEAQPAFPAPDELHAKDVPPAP